MLPRYRKPGEDVEKCGKGESFGFENDRELNFETEQLIDGDQTVSNRDEVSLVPVR